MRARCARKALECAHQMSVEVMRSLPWKTIATIVVGIALSTSCSGGSDDASSPATSAATTTLSQPSTTLRPVDTSFTGVGSADFCNLGKAFNDRFTNIGTPSTPAQLRTAMGEARNAITQAVAVAPPEIRTDMQVLSTAIGEFFSALDRVNFDANRLDLSSLRAFQAPEFVTASLRLEAYLKNVCRT